METWERISGWMKEVYADDLFEKSGQTAGHPLLAAEQAWRQFCLVPADFLRMSSEKVDDKAFRSASAFLMYHWGAGHTAGLSLGNASSGNYNVAFTLLRSFVELLFKGVLFQCLAHSIYRERLSSALKPTDALVLFSSHLSSMIKERTSDVTELESNTVVIFDLLGGDWMQSAFRLDMRSVVQQVADWGILGRLHDDPARTVCDLYGHLSENVHERIERTDIGRAIEEGTDIFEWPAPILPKSLVEFLDEFHLAMEAGVIAELNLVRTMVPDSRLREKCQQLLRNQAFRMANLGQASKLLKDWSS